MLCQLCGVRNEDDAVKCRTCGHKLLVLSGGGQERDDLERGFEPDPEAQLPFDEHLLERVSILEEVVKRTAQAMRKGLETLHSLEQKILLNHSGLLSLRQVLDESALVERTRWTELWESRLDRQLLALEKRERFVQARERITDLYEGDDPGAFRGLLDDAESSFVAYKLERAVAVLEEARRHDDQNYELEFFLAEVHFNEGHRDEALERFLRVLELRSGHLESLIYAGVLLHQDGDNEAAETLLRDAAERYPDAFLPRFALGALQFYSGRHEPAADWMETAVRLDGVVPQAWYLLGCAQLECGRAQPALEALQVAAEMEPDSAEVRLALAVAYLDRGWRKKAENAARTACALRPHCMEYRELVELLRPEGKRLEKSAVEALLRAEEAIFAGDVAGAVTAYRDALHHEPDNALLHIAYAMACIELDRLSEVEPAVSHALRMQPGDDLETAAIATLVESLRAQRCDDDAVRLARHALGSAGSDYAKGLMSFELGVSLACLASSGRRDVRPKDVRAEAEELLRTSQRLLSAGLERFPLAARGWLATSSRTGSDPAEAVRCLRQANELGSSPRILMQLAVAALSARLKSAENLDIARAALVGARRERERGGLPERLLGALRDAPRRE
ncbi:MAG: tetratricopeptide repeat protein [Thermoanaerobaculia bacterium]|nr:tetratricopeptide repeat protein [Thermoanaerobaculia bacterium]